MLQAQTCKLRTKGSIRKYDHERQAGDKRTTISTIKHPPPLLDSFKTFFLLGCYFWDVAVLVNSIKKNKTSLKRLQSLVSRCLMSRFRLFHGFI